MNGEWTRKNDQKGEVEKRTLNIAVAGSAGAYRWKNITVRWEKLCERLKSPTRTAETAAQYLAMSRDEKGKAKDGGGFVGGFLKNERRLAANVTCRSMLTLDANAAKQDFLPKFLQNCPHAAAVYTTHGHTPEAPRYRIVVPFAEDISPDCYNADTLSERIAPVIS